MTSLKAMHETTSLCEISRSIYGGLYTCFISLLHTRAAGSGVQVPSTDIPSGEAQVAFIIPAGTYPGLHLKII